MSKIHTTQSPHQYTQKLVKPEVDLDFQGHSNLVALLNCEKWIPRHQKLRNEEIMKIRKTRAIPQYHRAPVKPEVYLNFRDHPNIAASKTARNRFLDLENVGHKEITNIRKTQI